VLLQSRRAGYHVHRGVTTSDARIAGFDAERVEVPVGDAAVALWRVAALERYVDRTALLAADDPPDPPYWAHCWSGASVLAAAVPRDAGRVVDLGCGLGLPGIVAARGGARVTFVDRIPAPLAFVRASLAANGLAAGDAVVADVTAGALRGRFDLLLAAELVYDRATFAPLAAALAGLVARDGRVLLADAERIDTRDFYPALEAAGLRWRATTTVVREEGLPVTVRLVEATRR
jgi:predicted nicotinamide N-methyase